MQQSVDGVSAISRQLAWLVTCGTWTDQALPRGEEAEALPGMCWTSVTSTRRSRGTGVSSRRVIVVDLDALERVGLGADVAGGYRD